MSPVAAWLVEAAVGKAPTSREAAAATVGARQNSQGKTNTVERIFLKNACYTLRDVIASCHDVPWTTRAWVPREDRDRRPGPCPGVHIQGVPWGLAGRGGSGSSPPGSHWLAG